MTNEEIKQELEELRIRFTALEIQLNKTVEDEWVPWKPEKKQMYYTVSARGRATDYEWLGDATDNYQFDIGNCFKTEQETIDHSRRQRIQKRLTDLAKGFKPDWRDANQGKFFIGYNHRNQGKMDGGWCSFFKTQGTTYFQTADDRDNAIEVLGDDLEFLMGIE